MGVSDRMPSQYVPPDDFLDRLGAALGLGGRAIRSVQITADADEMTRIQVVYLASDEDKAAVRKLAENYRVERIRAVPPVETMTPRLDVKA